MTVNSQDASALSSVMERDKHEGKYFNF